MKQIEEYENKREQRTNQMRSVLDFAMGIIIILVGAFFLFFRNQSGIIVNRYFGKPDMLDKVMGVVCVLYGAWRIYRGYKKRYNR